jgi:hypothetical protein
MVIRGLNARIMAIRATATQTMMPRTMRISLMAVSPPAIRSIAAVGTMAIRGMAMLTIATKAIGAVTTTQTPGNQLLAGELSIQG